MFAFRPASSAHVARVLFSFASAGVLAAALAAATTPPPAQAHSDRKSEAAELFTMSGCAHCHGAALQGTGKGPALLNVRKKMTAEQIHKQIAEGGASMPAFGESITGDQIEELVELLRDKHPEKLLAHQAAQPAAKP